MNNHNERQRLQALFNDLEKVAANPASNTPDIKKEIEGLRARLLGHALHFHARDRRSDEA